MINGGKLLLSQIEIIKGIISQISRRPSFIVINGEIGAGKTTICEAIISYFKKKSQKNHRKKKDYHSNKYFGKP